MPAFRPVRTTHSRSRFMSLSFDRELCFFMTSSVCTSEEQPPCPRPSGITKNHRSAANPSAAAIFGRVHPDAVRRVGAAVHHPIGESAIRSDSFLVLGTLSAQGPRPKVQRARAIHRARRGEVALATIAGANCSRRMAARTRRRRAGSTVASSMSASVRRRAALREARTTRGEWWRCARGIRPLRAIAASARRALASGTGILLLPSQFALAI
jgi:hypothetical protein